MEFLLHVLKVEMSSSHNVCTCVGYQVEYCSSDFNP
jgi:hypothetical protein